MGRYYNGDINRKFWFAVQSSNAPSRFGGIESEPNYISYHFNEEHIPIVENEINNIRVLLGDNLKKFDDFFASNNGYNDNMLKDAGLDEKLLVHYADLGLGNEILNCIKDFGQCDFDAEL